MLFSKGIYYEIAKIHDHVGVIRSFMRYHSVKRGLTLVRLCIIGYSAVTLTLLFMISVVEKKLKAAQELSENFEVSRTLIVIANFSSEKKFRLEFWLFMNLKYAPFPLASLQTLTQPRHTAVLYSRHNTVDTFY